MKYLKLIIFAFLMILLLSCGNGKMKVKIEIRDSYGNIPAVAHAHLFRHQLTMAAEKSVPVDANGIAEIDIEEKGAYFIGVSIPDHKFLSLPICISPKSSHFEITVRPALLEFTRNTESVSILEEKDNFDPHGEKKMNYEGDGIFSYEMKGEGEVGYQIFGVSITGRSHNGQQHDRLEYDGGGDYRSYVNTKEGKAVIIFDLNKLPIANTFPPKVKYVNADPIHEQLFEIYSAVKASERTFRMALAEYRKNEDPEKKFPFRFEEILTRLNDKMGSEDKIIREFAALQYYYIKGVYVNLLELTKDEAQKIFDILGYDSPFYAFYPAPGYLAWILDKYIMPWEFYKRNDSDEVKKNALLTILPRAEQDKNVKECKRTYKLLKKYEDDPLVKYYLQLYSPDRPIDHGKTIPEFQFEDIYTGEKYSRESLMGQYYILDFWATWCSPCITELPHLRSARKKYDVEVLQILSVSLDSNRETIVKFQKKESMKWGNAHPIDSMEDTRTRFAAGSIPLEILVNPEGKIIAFGSEMRGARLEKTLEKFLK